MPCHVKCELVQLRLGVLACRRGPFCGRIATRSEFPASPLRFSTIALTFKAFHLERSSGSRAIYPIARSDNAFTFASNALPLRARLLMCTARPDADKSTSRGLPPAQVPTTVTPF